MDTGQGEQLIRDLINEVTSQVKGMSRYRWRAIIVMWLISLGAWFSIYSLPDLFSASARIYVDTESAIRPLLQGIAAPSDVMSEVNIVTRELLSRPNLADVARTTDLDHRTETDADLEKLLASLRKRISVAGNTEKIYTISYEDADRAKALAVVNSLVNTFVEKSLGGNRSDSSQAQKFLREQISDYERRLTEAEDRLAAFKRDNVANMPDQVGDYFTRLQTARSTLAATESKLSLAEERRSELIRQLEGEDPVFGIMPITPVGQTATGGFAAMKIRELETELEELRLRYTDKHPRIGQVLETIEMLKNQQVAEFENETDDDDGPVASNPLDLNPVYQNMRIQLTNTEVEIASLRAELKQQLEVVDELRRHVDTVPQVEANLVRLNRDYGVIRTKHEQLLQQLESANIGEDVEASMEEIKFRIIDPPFASLTPVGPQRQLLMTGAFLVAIGAGIALTFLTNLLRPVFYSGRTVTAVTGIPVLGNVSLLMSPKEIRRRRGEIIRVAIAFTALVILFSVLLTFSDELSPSVRAVTRMVSL